MSAVRTGAADMRWSMTGHGHNSSGVFCGISTTGVTVSNACKTCPAALMSPMLFCTIASFNKFRASHGRMRAICSSTRRPASSCEVSA